MALKLPLAKYDAKLATSSYQICGGNGGMALIAEAYASWKMPAEWDDAQRSLEAFCNSLCAGDDARVALSTLPDDAHFAARIVLYALESLRTIIGEEWVLVLDPISMRQKDGTYAPQLGIGLGRSYKPGDPPIIDRIDDAGATIRQARAMALCLEALLDGFDPMMAGHLIAD